jgi:TRAP-type C4-dicarboxylate transport system substrate-binding protein
MGKKGLLAIMVVSFLLVVFSVGHAAEAIKLKFSNYFPVTHRFSVLSGQFCDEVKKRTNGRVEMSHYPGGTLTTGPKMFNAVAQGISDLGLGTVVYNRGRFPLTEAQDVPLGFPTAWVGSQVMNDSYAKFKPKEWDSVHPLFFYSVGPWMLHSLKKPVRALEDVRGMKLRSVGRQAESLTALGGTPVPLEMTDVYESLQRGTIDGLVNPAEVLAGWKYGELIKYSTVTYKAVGNAIVFYVIMNKEKYDKLPDDIKKIVEEVSLEFKEKYAVAGNELDIEGIEFLKKHGGQLIYLSDAEVKKWQQATVSVVNDYKKDLLGLGFKQAEIDAYLGYIKERITFWTQKEKERGIPNPYR